MNKVAQVLALVVIGIAVVAERNRGKTVPAIHMNLDPKGDTIPARFLGGPLHGQNQVIKNRKYHRAAVTPNVVTPGVESVPAFTAVYVRMLRSRASGAWLYLYWGRT